MVRCTLVALIASCGFSNEVDRTIAGDDTTEPAPDASDPGSGGGNGSGSGSNVTDLTAIADTFLRAQYPSENHGGDTYHRNGSGNPGYYTNRAVYRFDLSALPGTCIGIVKAELRSYYFDQHYDTSPTLAVYRMTNDWSESQATWNQRMTGVAWTTAGGDYDGTAMTSVVAMDGIYGWLSWDITQLAIAWRGGTQPNYGVIVVEPNDLGGALEGRKLFHTREVSTAANRPHLRVTCR